MKNISAMTFYTGLYTLKDFQAVRWFEQQTGRHLAQGKISEILSSKYEYLDVDNPKTQLSILSDGL
jgi:hypothetical protein